MKLRKNIATSAEGFVFNPATGDSFTTNAIGAEIISYLKEDYSVKKITELICDKYMVEPLVFERDLDDFITILFDYRVLEP